jgi:hypothetical protein
LWWTKWHWGRYFSEFCGFSLQCHSTVFLHTCILPGGWTICPLVAAVQRRSLTLSKSTIYNFWCPGSICWIDEMSSLSTFHSNILNTFSSEFPHNCMFVCIYSWSDSVWCQSESLLETLCYAYHFKNVIVCFMDFHLCCDTRKPLLLLGLYIKATSAICVWSRNRRDRQSWNIVAWLHCRFYNIVKIESPGISHGEETSVLNLKQILSWSDGAWRWPLTPI